MNKKKDLKVIVLEVASILRKTSHLVKEVSAVVIDTHRIKKVLVWGESIGIIPNEAECLQEIDM